MFKVFSLTLGIILLVSCSKDNANPTGSGGTAFTGPSISFLKNLEGSNNCYPAGDRSYSNSSHLWVIDFCLRYIRYDQNFEAIDWFGFDKNGNLGVYAMSETHSQSKGYIRMVWVNDQKVYYRHGVNGPRDDSIFTFEISTGKLDTIGYPNEINYGGAIVFNSKDELYNYDWVNHIMNVYHADGSFKMSFGKNIWPANLFITPDDRIYSFDGTNTVTEFNIDGVVTNEFTADESDGVSSMAFDQSHFYFQYYKPSNVNLDRNVYYGKYDLSGNKIQDYKAIDEARDIFASHAFKGHVIDSYNDSLKVFQFLE